MLCFISSLERIWKKNNSTQWHDTSNILTEPRLRREVDTTFEKIQDLITDSSATEQCLTGIMNFLWMIFSKQTESIWGKKKHVSIRHRKKFLSWCRRLEWYNLHRTKISLNEESSIRIVIEIRQEKVIEELEEISVIEVRKKSSSYFRNTYKEQKASDIDKMVAEWHTLPVIL